MLAPPGPIQASGDWAYYVDAREPSQTLAGLSPRPETLHTRAVVGE
jgi:hypothetical protein